MDPFNVVRRFHKRSILLPTLLLFLLTFSTIFYQSSVNQGGKELLERANTGGEYTEEMRPKFWTRITDDVHLYSAYLDERGPEDPHIKIIGIKRMPSKAQVPRPLVQDITKVEDVSDIQSLFECKLFYEDARTGNLIRLSNSKLSYFVFEEGVKEFAGVFYKCFFSVPLHDYTSQLYVSLVPKNGGGYPDKLIEVHRVRRVGLMQEGSNYLSVCVRPLFGPLYDAQRVAQFIAFYESQGVKRFTFYSLSIGLSVRRYLSMLGHSVRLHEWNLPTGNMSELWDYGTLAALQDCIYENSSSNKGGFSIVVDLDEFVVPVMVESIGDLVARYPKSSQLLLRNVFYCAEYCDKLDETENAGEFPMFDCPLRTKRIWGVHHRSKYIAKAHRVLSVGHHFVTSFLNHSDPRYSVETVHVLPSVAYLGHFRQCGPLFGRKRPLASVTMVKDERLADFKGKMDRTHASRKYRELMLLRTT